MIITLKGGDKKEFGAPVTCLEVAKSIGEGLARSAVAAKVDGKAVDLAHVIEGDCELEILTLKDKEGLQVYRHTAAHVLAQAVKAIFPTCKLAIGRPSRTVFIMTSTSRRPSRRRTWPRSRRR